MPADGRLERMRKRREIIWAGLALSRTAWRHISKGCAVGDPVEAHMWLNLSAAGLDGKLQIEAAKTRDWLRRFMAPAMEEMESAQVRWVHDGDTVILADGRRVRLERAVRRVCPPWG